MRFGPWYPLAEARDRTPPEENMLQLRLASGLRDYPLGKSAMVHYVYSRDVCSAALAWAVAHGTNGIVCRHLIEIDDATDLAAFYEKLSDDFARRFGEPPRRE